MKAIMVFLLAVVSMGLGADEKTQNQQAVRLGVVGDSGRRGAFEKLKKHLCSEGYPVKLVYFKTYGSLVEGLDDKQVDIAWNSPLSHAQYHVRNDKSKTLAMREGDVGLKLVVVAGKNSGVKSAADLEGKRLLVDESGYLETLLSEHYLKVAGLDMAKVAKVPAKSRKTLLSELIDGKADAAVVPLNRWRGEQDQHPDLEVIYTSPCYNHCVFTAADDFDSELGSQFTRLLTGMSPENKLVAEFNSAEGTRRWIEGDSKGYEALIQALKERRKK